MSAITGSIGIVTKLRAVLWVGAYLALVLAPLAVILLGPVSPRRGFWIEFSIGLGFVGLAMLGMESILTARFPRLSRLFGQDALLQFHHQVGLVAFGMIFAHPIILVLVSRSYRSFLDPRVNAAWAFALTLVLVTLPTLIALSLWGRRLRLRYEWWRATHAALAVLVLTIGMVHIASVGHYLSNPWKQALWVGIASASFASVAHVRLIRPLRLIRRPYRVAAVDREGHHTWTITVTPERHERLSFTPGQFAWFTIAGSPFAFDQHPLSITSSASDPGWLRFTIEELGDHTSWIGAVKVGQRAYVDGPYGSLGLSSDLDPGSGVAFIARGIGITPIMSMLRTLADQRDPRPMILIDANDRAEDRIFCDELELLATRVDLRVVHILREAPDGWTGETGSVTGDVLDRHLLARDRDRWHYVLCGPPPMMEPVEQALLDRGIPLARIQSERFDIGAAGAIGPRRVHVRRLVVGLGVAMVMAAALFAM